jgi:alpha-L-fucosidase
VKIGPKKDIVGIYGKLAREHGLRFAVTNHSSHAWHWLQPAYDYDPEGPLAGCATTRTPDQGRRQGQVVGGLRPAGALSSTCSSTSSARTGTFS